MAKTKIYGNRIGDGSIENKHLSKDLKIPESNIAFNLLPHNHDNKSVLDIIRNSIPKTLTELDLKDVMYSIIEVSDARDVNKTLRQTINSRASLYQVEDIENELEEARRGYPTLSQSMESVEYDIKKELSKHIGSVSHKELDSIYSEIRAARGVYISLKDRLDGLPATGGGGNVSIISLTPWTFDMVLEQGKTVIELPNSYVLGNSTLQVFDGPVLLQSEVDYKELTPTKIEMMDSFDIPLHLRIIGVNSGRLFEWERRISGDDVTSKIELQDSYRPGGRELQVYEDGLLLREEEDYEEMSPHIILFKNPIPLGSLVTIYKRRN